MPKELYFLPGRYVDFTVPELEDFGREGVRELLTDAGEVLEYIATRKQHAIGYPWASFQRPE